MANGDITAIRKLGKASAYGGGGTLAGRPKQNKVLVWGQITGTHEDTDGVNGGDINLLRAIDLATCDVIKFDVVSVAGTYNVGAGVYTAHLGRDDNNIYVVIDGATRATAGQECIINYFAIGDDAAAAELT